MSLGSVLPTPPYAGFETGTSETPITPIMVGEAATAYSLSSALFDRGVLAIGIGFPTVPRGAARVRTIVTATHTRQQLEQALEVMVEAAKALSIL